MYPILKEGVTIGTLNSEGSDIAGYYIENTDGEEYLISPTLFQTFLEADGTRPLIVSEDDRGMLEYLDGQGFLQRSRFVKGNGLFNRFIIFPVGSRLGRIRKAAGMVNTMLPVISVILFVFGFFLVRTQGTAAGSGISLLLYYGLMLFSIVLHEAGHLNAGIAYGYKICDVGVLLLGVIPCGAYVAHEEEEKATVREKIQFAMAGAEANLVMAGVCLIGAAVIDSVSGTLSAAANTNVALVFLNLLPAMGLDGEVAVSALFGVSSITRTAQNWLVSGSRTRRLARSGLPGTVCICCFIIVLAAKLLFWLIIGLNLLTVVLFLFCQVG